MISYHSFLNLCYDYCHFKGGKKKNSVKILSPLKILFRIVSVPKPKQTLQRRVRHTQSRLLK